MSAPIKISQPSVDVQGLCLVQVGGEVKVFYRNANGDLESGAGVTLTGTGSGIGVQRPPLPAGSAFSADANGRVQVVN